MIYSDFPFFIYIFYVFLDFSLFPSFIYRSRLSLDLSSPTFSNTYANQLNKHFSIQFHNDPQIKSNTFHKSPTFSSGCNNKRVIKSKSNNNIISPRYTEFKTFNSAFDGLQALEKSNNNHNNNNCSINNSNNNNNNNINNNISNGDNNSSGVANVAGATKISSSTTTSIMINCGGVVANNATSPSMTNNSNISTVLLNSASCLSDSMTPLSRSASLPIKAPSLTSGNSLI